MHRHRNQDRKTKRRLANYFVKSKKLLALMEGAETTLHATGSVHRFNQYRERGEGMKSGVNGIEEMREERLIVEEKFAFLRRNLRDRKHRWNLLMSRSKRRHLGLQEG